MDSSGVIPEPAARHTTWRAFSGAAGVPNRPAGVITSTGWPGCSSAVSQPENRPLAIRFTPIRRTPCSASSAGVEQME